MIDFTECRRTKKTYGGANGNKIGIIYNNEQYMLKFPSKPTKATELSYANGCISEYICCHIYQMLGIPAQETLLGVYHTKNKDKLVVACKDFTQSGVVLQDFASLKNQVIDSEQNGYGTELSDILYAIEEQEIIDPKIVTERFWNMFVVDALLGNFDRHNGNWGFLYDQNKDEVKLAPVFDCGSCLYPQADKETIMQILQNEEEINARIYNFPTSAIKQENKKISYHSFFTNTENEECLKAITTIVPSIQIQHIRQFINNMEEIDDLQKEFYVTMIRERYEKILIPAYEYAKNCLYDTEIITNMDLDDL